jgi:hypothetical protein
MSNASGIAHRWVKSTYSGGDGDCVEWAPAQVISTGLVPVRDSKSPDGPSLSVPFAAWAGLVDFVR